MRRSELFTLVHGVRLFCWYFSLTSIMEKYCQKGGTVCAPNSSSVHVGCHMLPGRDHAHMHSAETFSFSVAPCTSAERDAARADGPVLMGRHRTATLTGDLSFPPHNSPRMCLLIDPVIKGGKAGPER